MRGEIICLSQPDEDLCVCVAHERHDRNRRAGRKNLLVDTSRRPEENELAGARAELAVRRFLNLECTFEELCLKDPDGGVDIAVNGYTIDVKWTWKVDGRLIFSTASKFRALSAVLVSPHNDYLLRLCGVISRKRFLENFEWYESAFCDHPVLSLPQNKLSPIHKMTEFLEQPRRAYA